MEAVQSKVMKYVRADIGNFIGAGSAFAREHLALQKSNLFLWMPVMVALGVGFYFSLKTEPPLFFGVLGWMLCAGVCILAFPSRDLNIWRQGAFLLSCGALLVATGFVASQVRTLNIDAPVLDKRLGPVDVEGTIRAVEPLEGNKGSRLILSDLEIERLSPDKTPRLVRLQLRKDEGISVGQRIRVLAIMNPPSSALIPGGFDFRRYLYFQEVGAVGFTLQAPEIIQDAVVTYAPINAMRYAISEKVSAALPEKEAGFATALMTGLRKGISEEDFQAMQDAGLAHTLAISGLHVGIVAGALFFFLRLFMAMIPSLALHYPIKKFAAVAAMGGAVFYMLLAGATVPTQRAVLMSGVVFLAIILDRSPISLRLVAFAALAILLIAPESLMSASFQLSFAAVTALIAFYDATRSFWGDFNRRSGFFRKAALYFIAIGATTLIASLATAPFSLFHFQHVSVWGSMSNFAAVPLLAFWIMPAALIAALSMPFGLEAWPLYIMGQGILQMLAVAHWCAGLPGAASGMGQTSFSAFVLFSFSCLFFILWRGRGKVLALPMLLVAFWFGYQYKTPDILVSSDHHLFAFRLDEALYMSSLRKEKFVRKNWERLLGYEEDTAQGLPYESKEPEGAVFCDPDGCRMTLRGRNIAFSRKPYSQPADCVWADILIAENPVKVKSCRAGVVVDKFDTWRSGAYAIWLTDNDIRVQSVQDVQGRRPWTPEWPEKR